MEKQETRVKCDGCGKAYKIKLPVTEKPVSFKCKSCGHVMKVKVGGDAKPAESPPPGADPLEGFESFGDFASDYSHGAPAEQSSPWAGAAGPSSPAEQAGPAAPSTQQPKRAISDTPTALGDSFQFEDSTEEDLALLSREPEKRQDSEFKFETTQLPEETPYEPPSPAPMSIKSPSIVETLQTTPGAEKAAGAADNRRWLTLVNEEVRGPFTSEEVKTMIEDGSISPETSLRMGERPWIKASQVPAFRKLFARGISGKLASISLADNMYDQGDESAAPFELSAASLLPFPLGQGTNWQSLAIFSGIAVVICTVLGFDFLIGLPVCIVGWIVLYGYLGLLMQTSMKYPDNPPPPWDFNNIQGIATNGAKVFAILFVYSLLPVTISMLFMIAFFLNGMSLLGYVFLLVTVLVFLVSMLVVPASLAIVSLSENVGAAINPGKFLAVIKGAGKSYLMLAGVSLIVGLACMLTTILSIFLVELPGAGFVVVGILMGAVFSYGHFVWFHVVGLFTRSSMRLVGQVVSGAPANG